MFTGGNCPTGGGAIEDDTSRRSSDHDPVFVRFGLEPTAVDLARFEAYIVDDHVRLVWETTREIDTLGFNLYRSDPLGGEAVQLNTALIPSQSPGGGWGAEYTYDDGISIPGTYHYALEEIDRHGTAHRYGPVTATLAEHPTAVGMIDFQARAHPVGLRSVALLGAGWLLIRHKKR
ncbi:MAG: hypothetical protein JXB35_10615 [Anaerolineae bacterium]|nr:hypothetical protein [Anaerolineae bacterium]